MKVVSYYYNVIGGGIMECKESLHIGFLRQSTKTRMLLIYIGMLLN